MGWVENVPQPNPTQPVYAFSRILQLALLCLGEGSPRSTNEDDEVTEVGGWAVALDRSIVLIPFGVLGSSQFSFVCSRGKLQSTEFHRKDLSRDVHLIHGTGIPWDPS
uniref:Uncharacterized protein n=1 Tax=Cucumis melo TaxID=3656 RepID=A0A9I9E805_CUCME